MSFHSRLVGADLHSPSQELVENNSGIMIPALRAVSFNGLGFVHPQVVLGGTDIIGITQYNFPTGKVEHITCYGLLTGMNTSSYSVNDFLYSSISGNLSTTVNGRKIAQVLKVDAVSGMIYVFPLGTNYVAASVTAITKSGRLLNSDFSGSPKTGTVTFTTPFPSAPYAVNITGIDTRAWSIETMTTNGFVINSNANSGLLGDVYWEAQQYGEF